MYKYNVILIIVSHRRGCRLAFLRLCAYIYLSIYLPIQLYIWIYIYIHICTVPPIKSERRLAECEYEAASELESVPILLVRYNSNYSVAPERLPTIFS